MTPETIALINQMSGTLTGAAADIWASALMQARMQAWIEIIIISIFGLFLGAAALTIVYFSKKVVKGTEASPDYVLDSDKQFGCWMSLGICTFLWAAITLSEAANIITMFTNPTFWAITHLIGGGSN
jgi:hypothetical protein